VSRFKFYTLLVFVFTQFTLNGQPEHSFPKNDFGPPFEGPIEVIGTFCELRPNHFHGGLDIRTFSKIGRHVISVGDGYVSRINISTTGYGKALYITHPNGYTSVYAHLNDFPDKIKWYITKNQYLLKSYEVELYPEADLLQVKKGEMVAYSGNTGSSQGPHLHFEIRETKSEAPVNPLLFGIKMMDHMKPSILSLYLYRKDTLEKVHNGHYPSSSLSLYERQTVVRNGKRKRISVRVDEHVLQYGMYALGANLRDYAISKGNNNGVNYIKIYRNDSLFYDCRIEKFLFSQMRMHNNYIDYRRQKQSGVKMHKLFKDDGSTLEFWEHSPTDGWFEIIDSAPQKFRIVISDSYGYTDEETLTISGSPSGKTIKEFIQYSNQNQLCYANKDNTIVVAPEFKIGVPKHALYSDYHIAYTKNYGHNYTIGNTLVPLDQKLELQFMLNPEQVKLAEKYTIFSKDGRSYGGELQNKKWLHVHVKEFGTYYMVLDTFPPHIRAYSINRNGYFSFNVSDGTSGVKDYDFYVDDVWVLLEYDSKTGLVSGKIPNKLESGEHRIRLVVRDNRMNESSYEKNINIP
jgi:hypothetical protein